MRILFSSNPMFGHVNPILPLAVAASRAGHTVLFATGADMADHVRRHGVDAAAVGLTYAESREHRDEPWLDYFARVAGERAHALVPVARAWKPDLVVREETELAGAIAAAATGSRCVVHGLGIPPPAALWESLRPRFADIARRWNATEVADRFSDVTYVDICPPSLRRREDCFWAEVQPVRPTAVPTAALDEPPADLATLPHATTAHVTLGTVYNDNIDLLRTAITALSRLDINVVVTTGPRSEPAALGPLPRNAVAHTYVPHRLLLPRCSVVVSQGGAGVLFAALAHGLPQLVLPQGADQFANAAACVAAGAALSLTDDVACDAIARSVEQLLDEPTFATAAARIGAEIDAMPNVDEAIAHLLRDTA